MGISPRVAGQIAFDFSCWLVAFPLATWFRYDYAPPPGYLATTLKWGAIAGILSIAIGFAFSLYRGRYRYGSFDEIAGVVVTVAITTIGLTALILWNNVDNLPRGTAARGGTLALGMMLGGRFALRYIRERMRIRRGGAPTLIYGAGEGGGQILRALQTTPNNGCQPVALIDDDPAKRRLRIYGVPVRGTIDDLESLARRYRATILVVAFAQVEARQLRELDTRCRALGVELRVIPSPVDIVRGSVQLSDVVGVTDEDLLGRRPIETNETDIGEMLRGKRVLITGAGGSIGSELSRQVHSYGPAFLGLLDRDESALHALHLTMFGTAMGDSDDLLLADIRDAERMREVMAQVRPDVVFHAAALKHLPMLEAAPAEAYKTNVLGTRNVLQAAHEQGVPLFINISTDKAADPTSVLGYSKRITERLTAGIEPPTGGRYLSVRFGNVLGSRGSVLTAFRAQIAAGGPVTVTHPDVTRYFMTIKEAVHLVLQAATIGRDSETLILDMGEPIRIADVAQHMIDKSGKEIKIEYTGLRDGEKLHEVLASSAEVDSRPMHPLVTHVSVEALPLNELEEPSAASAARDQISQLALSRALGRTTAATDPSLSTR